MGLSQVLMPMLVHPAALAGDDESQARDLGAVQTPASTAATTSTVTTEHLYHHTTSQTEHQHLSDSVDRLNHIAVKGQIIGTMSLANHIRTCMYISL